MKYKQFEKTFSLSLPESLYRQIAEQAEKNNVSKGQIIREMIDQFINKK